MITIPQIDGKPWTRYIGLAVLFVYGGLVALEIAPADNEAAILGIVAAILAWISPSPTMRTGR